MKLRDILVEGVHVNYLWLILWLAYVMSTLSERTLNFLSGSMMWNIKEKYLYIYISSLSIYGFQTWDKRFLLLIISALLVLLQSTFCQAWATAWGFQTDREMLQTSSILLIYQKVFWASNSSILVWKRSNIMNHSHHPLEKQLHCSIK